MAELYAILTTLPVQPRISASLARQLIQRDVLDVCEVVSLSDEDYASVIDHLSDVGVVGGATYDALILHAAVKTKIDQIVTLNEKDFRRIYPELADKVIAPEIE